MNNSELYRQMLRGEITSKQYAAETKRRIREERLAESGAAIVRRATSRLGRFRLPAIDMERWRSKERGRR